VRHTRFQVLVTSPLWRRGTEALPSTQYAISNSCGSGVDDDGQCDGGGFKLDTAAVAVGAAVERKEVR
jgi:hypothetical protein